MGGIGAAKDEKDGWDGCGGCREYDGDCGDRDEVRRWTICRRSALGTRPTCPLAG